MYINGQRVENTDAQNALRILRESGHFNPLIFSDDNISSSMEANTLLDTNRDGGISGADLEILRGLGINLTNSQFHSTARLFAEYFPNVSYLNWTARISTFFNGNAAGVNTSPQITPRLQQEFSQFISTHLPRIRNGETIRLSFGDIRITISYENIRRDTISLEIYHIRGYGRIIRMTSDLSGQLFDLSDIENSISGHTRESAAILFEDNPSFPLREALAQAYHLPQVTQEMRVQDEHALRPLRTHLRRCITDPSTAVEVRQHTFAVTRPGEGRTPFIQSANAGPCVILSLYDPQTQTGLMAHFDVTTDVGASFTEITAYLQRYGVNIGSMEAGLVGGWFMMFESEELVRNLREELRTRSIEIVEQDVLHIGTVTFPTPRTQSYYSVTLDTTTGELFDYNEIISTTPETSSLIYVQGLTTRPLIFAPSPHGLR